MDIKFIEFCSFDPSKDVIVNVDYIVSIEAEYLPYGMGRQDYFILTINGKYKIRYEEYVKIKGLLKGGK
jgi:hypothetical protein